MDNNLNEVVLDKLTKTCRCRVISRAKIKEAMVPWVIGIFVSFGAYGIWKLVMNIFYKI